MRYKVTKQTIARSVRRLHVTEYRPAPNVIRLNPDEVDAAFSGHLVQRSNTEPQPAYRGESIEL